MTFEPEYLTENQVLEEYLLKYSVTPMWEELQKFYRKIEQLEDSLPMLVNAFEKTDAKLKIAVDALTAISRFGNFNFIASEHEGKVNGCQIWNLAESANGALKKIKELDA